MPNPLVARIAGLVVFASITASSLAHERYFAYTYDWYTPYRFEREVELHWTQFEGGDSSMQLEFEYGATDRWAIAPYLLFEREGGKTKFEGFKLEQRYRFGEFAYGKLLPAIYLEVEKENDHPYELEGKLIGTYLPNSKWVASGNLIFARSLESGAKTQHEYSLGIAHKFAPQRQLGLEAFGSLDSNEHYLGPTFGFGASYNMKVIGTAAAPIAGGGPFQFRLILEKEF